MLQYYSKTLKILCSKQTLDHLILQENQEAYLSSSESEEEEDTVINSGLSSYWQSHTIPVYWHDLVPFDPLIWHETSVLSCGWQKQGRYEHKIWKKKKISIRWRFASIVPPPLKLSVRCPVASVAAATSQARSLSGLHCDMGAKLRGDRWRPRPQWRSGPCLSMSPASVRLNWARCRCRPCPSCVWRLGRAHEPDLCGPTYLHPRFAGFHG
jgi:hypothetical protein